MTNTPSIRSLFTWLFKEEWRLHARLFGGPRFALVPLILLVGSATTYRLLLLADVTPATMVAGVHAIAILLGLQVGSIALVGRDMIENLLGDTTVLLASVRTLPVSGRRLLGVFLIKDVCYYAALYIIPTVVGFTALFTAGITPAHVLTAILTVTAAFTVGVASSVALVSLASRSRPITLGIVTVIAATIYLDPALLVRVSPYAVYTDASLLAALTTTGYILAVGGLGFRFFELTRDTTTRTTSNQYHRLRHALPGRTPWLVAKALLDVTRSTGGLAKVIVSFTLVIVVVGAVLEGVTRAIGLRPAAGPAFAGLLALASFTTYNWLTTVDDANLRRALPVRIDEVLWSVLLAHLLLSLPIATLLLVASAYWFGTQGLLAGILALPGLIVYIVGVTAYLTGLHPGERLFDAGRFATFSIAAAIVAVPVLLAAFAAPTVTFPLPWLVTAGSLVAGGIGLLLIRLAGPKWTRVDRRDGTG